MDIQPNKKLRETPNGSSNNNAQTPTADRRIQQVVFKPSTPKSLFPTLNDFNGRWEKEKYRAEQKRRSRKLDADLSQRTNVQELNLCDYKDPLAEDFALIAKHLPHLKALEGPLGWDASNAIANHICKLTALEKLDIANCYITNSQMQRIITSLTSLKFVSFANSEKHVNSTLSSLSMLTDLNHLNLTNCKKVSDLSFVSPLTNLTYLNLSDCGEIPSGSFTHLERLIRLRSLTLSYSKHLKDRQLISIARNLTSLRDLDVGSCFNLTSNGLGSLSSLRKLEILDLSRCAVDKNTFCGFSQLTNLRVLNLFYCEEVENRNFRHISNCTKIEELNCNGCTKLTDLALQHISQFDLTKLILDDSQVTDRGIAHISHSTRMTELGLRWCKVTDQGLRSIADFRHLVELNLYGCAKFTDIGLGFISLLTNLKKLWFMGNNNITDRGVRLLFNLQNLEQINLELCMEVTITREQMERAIPTLTGFKGPFD